MVYKNRVLWLTLLLSLCLLVLISLPAAAAMKDSAKGKLAKATMDPDMTQAFDGNRIFTYMANNGQIVTQKKTASSGMYWPSFASGKQINYSSGVWVSGKINNLPVTACAEYESEWAPGKVLPSGQPDNKDDPKYKLYKINKADQFNPMGNPDWMNWPIDQGAPWIDNNRNGTYEPLAGDTPAIMGDQMIWYVMNDLNIAKHANAFKSQPMGLECKVTIWGYNRPDEFGDMMFAKFQLRNVKSTKVDSTYLGVWADVDLGDGNDDFVGCDTTLSLGYTYNAAVDKVYGVQCPALGYDFFQGAILKGAAKDTAKAFGKRIPGYKNMGMSGFTKYINGGGDTYGDPETAQDAFNYMSGLTRGGVKYVDPITKKAVYPCRYGTGDPVKGTGWLDKLDHPAGDRRQLVTCGPFTLAAGDSQEVVTGMLIAQGSDNFDSITRLKAADKKAQTAYDTDFKMPPGPPPPTVKATGTDGKIFLTWEGNAESYEAEDLIDVDSHGAPSYYTFQGYNVYQLENDQGSGGVKKLATIDLKDGIMDIKDFELIGSLGENVEHTVHKGTDSGLRRYFAITNDPLRGSVPLVNNRPYYFAVTAYGYNEIGIPKTMESTKVVVTVYPQQPFGQKVLAAYNDSLKVTHTGPSQGNVAAFIVDPGKVTGHDYKVTFKTVQGETVWDVTDVTVSKTVLASQTNQSGDGAYNVIEGLSIEPTGPALGLNFGYTDPAETPAGYEGITMGWGITTADNGNRWFTGYDVPTNIGVSPAAFFGGINNFYDYWGTSASRYVSLKLEFIKDPGADSSSWSKAYVSRRDLGYVLGPKIGWFPGKVWNIDVNPPERLAVAFVEDNRLAPANALWDMGWDTITKTYANAGSQGNRELLWLLDSKYDGATSMLKADWAGKNVGGMYQLFPAPRGTREWNAASFSMKIYASKPNSDKDVFTFSTNGKGAVKTFAYSKEDIAKINVFPNPYFGANIEETRTLQHFVRFTHLPPTATIRVYTLAGELIRTLQHTDGSQFEQWNLQNDFSIPVASGMYIVHVDCGKMGERVLKMAVLMAEERLRQF